MVSMVSNELEVLEELRRPGSDFARLAGMDLGKDAGEGANAFIEALLWFGRTERIAHAAQRRTAAGLKPDPGTDATVRKFNNNGLAALADATAALQRAAASIPAAAPKKEALAAAADVFGDLKGLFADCDIKPSDVGKLAKLLDEATAAVASGEKSGFDAMLKKLGELDAARRRPDRGDVENIPIWKIAAIAVFLGLTLAVVLRCFANRNHCSDVIQAALVAGMAIASLVIRFC